MDSDSNHQGFVSTDPSLAAQLLFDGHVIALPTETVYGLAALVTQFEAIHQIYQLKGRPRSHPLIVHVLSHTDLTKWVDFDQIHPSLKQKIPDLVQAFWPGPLTLVFPKSHAVPLSVTSGHQTIAMRAPSHPFAIQVLEQLEQLALSNPQLIGFVAPSANKFGRVSPTSSAHVVQEFNQQIAVFDGDCSQIGIESTILDLTREQPYILRYGQVQPDDIERVIGLKVIHPHQQQQTNQQQTTQLAPRVSGDLKAHYAPATKMIWSRDFDLASRFSTRYALMSHEPKLLDAAVLEQAAHLTRMPVHADDYANQLYHQLRHADELQLDLIVVQDIRHHKDWFAILDRLGKAIVGSNLNNKDFDADAGTI